MKETGMSTYDVSPSAMGLVRHKRIVKAIKHIDDMISEIEKYNYDLEELADGMVNDLCHLKDILGGRYDGKDK